MLDRLAPPEALSLQCSDFNSAIAHLIACHPALAELDEHVERPYPTLPLS